MGVLNVTPDSFYDGGRYLAPDDAIELGLAMVAEGVDIVDVGGESSRPGASPVAEDEELARVVPVVEALAPAVRVSVDTVKPSVAVAAVAAGATLINDVAGTLWPVAAELGVGWVAMHRQGSAADMQRSPRYDDVVAQVHAALLAMAARAGAAGVEEIWFDPGIGFGKTVEHNLSLLAHVAELADAAHTLGHTVLIGTSRKRFLGALGGASLPVEDRLEGSLATATFALVHGADMVRVHDVAPSVLAASLVAERPAA